MANWKKRRSGIACISFTNVAWKEIGNHLQDAFGLSRRPHWPHFLGTIDSFVNQFIFLPFGHLVMGCSCSPEVTHPGSHNYSYAEEWLNQLRQPRDCRLKGCSPTCFQFNVDGQIEWRRELIKKQPKCDRVNCANLKAMMVRSGMALPSDAMYWGMKVLNDWPQIRNAISSRFPEIIIDEAQDTTEIQSRIISRLSQAGSHIVLVGDPDQSIYGFTGARPELFNQFASKWHSLPMTENFRSSQLICNAVHRFSEGLPDPAAAAGPHRDFSVRPMIVRYDSGQESKIINCFDGILRRHSIDIDDTAILAWRHDLVLATKGDKTVNWPRCVSALMKRTAWAAIMRDAGFLSEAHESLMYTLLDLCLRRRSFGHNYEAISHIGIREWRRKSWSLLHNLLPSSNPLSDWGLLTRPIVDRFIQDTGWCAPVDLSKRLTRCNHADALCPVSVFVNLPRRTGGLTCKVIHQAKGETYDAVMVVCSAGNSRRPGDIVQWIKPALTAEGADAKRTGYVAMKRPRKLLVLAIPTNTSQDVIDELSSDFELIDSLESTHGA
jgi:DNA helicase-2/ATP-dependent DNA helicase PcrA